MSDRFKNAIKSGFEAAQHADSALAEIQAMFRDVASSLKEETGGKIELSLHPRVSFVVGMTAIIGGLSNDTELPRSVDSKLVLRASRKTKTGPEKVDLAHVDYGAAGYPVAISYEDEQWVSDDKTALEEALANLLQHPGTGRRLARMLADGSPSTAEPEPEPEPPLPHQE